MSLTQTTNHSKGRTIRKVMGGGELFYVCIFFPGCQLCMHVFLNMFSRMQFFLQYNYTNVNETVLLTKKYPFNTHCKIISLKIF